MRKGALSPSPGPDVVLHPDDLMAAAVSQGLYASADILRIG